MENQYMGSEKESLKVSVVVPTSPYRIYQAWLNGMEHGAMTGKKATIQPWSGGRHSSWDGYVWGRNKDLQPSQRILQSWRSGDFDPADDDSRVEIIFTPTEGGTRVTIIHDEIPKGLAEILEPKWKDFYLAPIKAYFASGVPRTRQAAAAAQRISLRRAKARALSNAGKKKVKSAPRKQAAKKKSVQKPTAKKKAVKKATKKKSVKKAAAKKKAVRKPAKKTKAKKKK